MFSNAHEMLAYTYEGRQLHSPEDGAWIAFDCTACGAHTEAPIRSGLLDCDGCDAMARAVPAQLAITPDASIVAEPVQAPEEHHEAVRLFTPAPNQLDGQLSL